MNPRLTLRRALLALTLLAAGACWAQQAKTTRILVAFPPGGPVDFVARTLADALSKELGQPVLVDNKAGGNGAVAAEQLMRSPADGSTLWLTSVGAVAINPALYEKLAYDPQRDLAPVSLVVNNVEVLVVNAKAGTAGPIWWPPPARRATSRSPWPLRALAVCRTWRPSSSTTRPRSICCMCPTKAQPLRSTM